MLGLRQYAYMHHNLLLNMTAYASDALTIVALALFMASVFMLCVVLV
jgi:hypothetical protein